MLVIPSKNPGHSGTDFKHRKAFYKATQGQKKKVKTNGANYSVTLGIN